MCVYVKEKQKNANRFLNDGIYWQYKGKPIRIIDLQTR